MNIRTNVIIISAAIVLCAAASLTPGQECPQSCESLYYNGHYRSNIHWGDQAGGTGDGGELAIGYGALSGNTGYLSLGIGDGSLSGGNNGQFNVGVGAYSLSANTSGSFNTAIGSDCLEFNSTGNNNTAVGNAAMEYTNTGSNNTAVGTAALLGDLFYTVSGSNNTAVGYEAMFDITTGNDNTATGYNALYYNTTGARNTAVGRGALYKNSTASYNTAVGYQALNKNTVGIDNVATGYQALLSNTSGLTNTAVGAFALQNSVTGAGNIAIGFNAGTGVTSGSNNIDIGNTGANESSTIRVGGSNQTNTYIAGINGVTVAGGIGVIVDSSGHLGTTTSSARYKDEIKPMDKASEAILSLKPVTFRYKKELDPKAIPQFGLVAEQVEKVEPDLVTRDDKGEPYSVRYEAVNAMLLNEFLKEHHKVEEEANKNREQEATIRELKSAVAEQQREIKALSLGLQKVSNQVELTIPVVRVAVNNP